MSRCFYRVARGQPEPRTELVIARVPIDTPPGLRCSECKADIAVLWSWTDRRTCSQACSERRRDRLSR